MGSESALAVSQALGQGAFEVHLSSRDASTTGKISRCECCEKVLARSAELWRDGCLGDAEFRCSSSEGGKGQSS